MGPCGAVTANGTPALLSLRCSVAPPLARSSPVTAMLLLALDERIAGVSA